MSRSPPKILWDSSKSIFQRLLDGVDPEVIDELEHAAGHIDGVREVSEAKVRWLGHRMHAELNITVERGLTVAQGHDVSSAVQAALLEHLPYLSSATIHVDPVGAAGSDHHPQAGQNDHHADEHAHAHGPDHAH